METGQAGRGFAWWAMVLAPPTLVAVAVVGVLQWVGAAAAQDVRTLTPTFDGADAARAHVAVTLEPRITGIDQPTDLAWVPGHPDRVVVLSKRGTAYLTRGGVPEPWFTVDVATSSELGLLGIAFHPNFASNGQFFVNVTPSVGSGKWVTRILRGRVDPSTLADPQVGAVVLEVAQPYPNHNAGQIAFGPDGLLYVGLGDGGSGGDPQGNGQKMGVLLGKMLRIDVDRGTPYAVPPSNPFVGTAGVRPEIWASGLRNPWRFTFDPQGRMIVADVGQHEWEEIDWVRAGDNLGWNVREADRCFAPKTGCGTAGFVDPIWSYPHSEGISVTGGVVWTAPGPLAGKYLFADFGTGRVWALEVPAERGRVAQVAALGRFDLNPSAFGRAPDGAVWVADYAKGAVFQIVPR